MLNADEQKDHARRFFEHFSRVMLNPNDADGEMAAFDPASLMEAALAKKLIPAGRLNDQAQLRDEFRNGVRQTSLYRGDMHWGTYHIMSVKQPRQRALVVVTRHPNETTNTSLRLRWWLSHSNNRWLITEMEDMDYGIRLSTVLAGGLVGADPPLRTLHDAADSIVIRNNFDEADRILGGLAVKNLPPAGAATYHMLIASIRSRQSRWEDAIAGCDSALRLESDMPGADYLASVCLNHLRRDDQALKRASAAQKSYGDDPVICYEIGVASANTGQFAAAAVQYRKALDANPNHKNAFLSLLRCVGPDVQNNDIGDRLRKMKNPSDNFQQFADDCWMARDTATVQILANSMLQLNPQHPEANFYKALAQADQERLVPALASLRVALAQQAFDARRDFYYAEFARCIVSRDLTMQVYAKLPDSRRAFRALGDELKLSGKFEDLPALIAEHVKKWPRDPQVLLFQGDLQLRDEQYALADKSYTKAFAEINDPPVLERYRFNRINARYLAGDVLGAYHAIGPQRLCFQQLANACWYDKKMAELKLLVEAHDKNDAIDPQLTRFRWRLAIFDKRFNDAGKSLRSVFGRNVGNDPDRRLIEDFLYDMIDTGNVLEGYQRCPDRQLALEIIMTDLSRSGRDTDLKGVVDSHRQAFPNDPVLQMCTGALAADKQDWAAAVAAYRLGWKHLPEAKKQRWSHAYQFAAVKLGKPVQAYVDMGSRPDQFRQLTTTLLNDKQTDQFEELMKVQRRQQRNLIPELPAYEARLKLLHGKHAEAADLLLNYLKDRPRAEQQRIGDSFLNDLARFDLAPESYRCLPDKRDAFGYMVFKYRLPERAKEYGRLIEEHARLHPDDPRLLIERAELHFLKKEYAEAEKTFVQARRINPKDNQARFGLIRTRIRLGKAADAYRELGASSQTFLDVANQCVFLKDGAQLERVVAAHRKAFPSIKNLTVWDIEVLYQKKDYAETVKALEANRALFKSPLHRWKCESYLVRSLVKLKKTDAAIAEAETIAKRRDSSQVLLALAVASKSDVPRLIELFEKKNVQRFFLEDCYRDEDLGALLRSDAFSKLRERFPPPPNVTPIVPFDDDNLD
ncbi:MAG TPA: tetratricopeptide repeat protein, partial [Gemmataceae bacterium]|nr:tetratricopeptide repeat protein [Gemmataceae bacterium]